MITAKVARVSWRAYPAVLLAMAIIGLSVAEIYIPPPPSSDEYYHCSYSQTYLDLSNKGEYSLKPFGPSCSSLESVDLSNNYFKKIHAGTFDELIYLTYLDLRNNELSNIGANVFDYNSNLARLYLGSNSLSTLPMGLTESLEYLVELDLSGNELDCIFCVSAETSATNIDYLGYNLRFVDSSCSGLYELLWSKDTVEDVSRVSIDLSGSDLTSVNANALTALTSLNSLSLANNYINSVSSSLLEYCTDLETISLSNNALSALPSTLFSTLYSLQHLYASSNEISNLPVNILSGSPSLISVDLSNNYLTNIPGSIFDNNPNVQEIDLSQNQFYHLPSGLLKHINSLGNIDISDNPLDCIPKSFKNYPVESDNTPYCKSSHHKKGVTLSIGAIVGIVCGTFIVVLIIVASVLFIWKRRQGQSGEYQPIGVVPAE